MRDINSGFSSQLSSLPDLLRSIATLSVETLAIGLERHLDRFLVGDVLSGDGLGGRLGMGRNPPHLLSHQANSGDLGGVLELTPLPHLEQVTLGIKRKLPVVKSCGRRGEGFEPRRGDFESVDRHLELGHGFVGHSSSRIYG